MFDRDEDMISTGTRHPFLGRYKVGFTKEGKILALDLSLYANCGYSLDLSSSVSNGGISISSIGEFCFQCNCTLQQQDSEIMMYNL